MKRVIDKRGITTEGFLIGFIIVIVLLFVVGAIIWNFYGEVKTTENLLPSDLEKSRIACSGYVGFGAVSDFCYTFREAELTSGKKMYINCQYPELYRLLGSDGKYSEDDCNGDADDNAEAYCEVLKKDGIKGFEERLVNAKICYSADGDVANWGVEPTAETTDTSVEEATCDTITDPTSCGQKVGCAWDTDMEACT